MTTPPSATLRRRLPVIGVLLLSSIVAYAQPSAPATGNETNETVTLSPFLVNASQDKGYLASNSVSGSRMDTPIKDLPFALQAFTEEFIKDQHPMNIMDIAIYSPGVTYRSNDFNEGNANLAIRGFAIGSAGNTMVLRDGYRGPPIFDFTNVVRMEIVKGPASFLYGQLAPGGMVNIITKSPKDKFAATVSASYGSYNEYSAALDVTGPLSKSVSYRIALSDTHDIEYWKPYKSDQSDIAPQILWKLNDNASLSVKYERFSKHEDPPVFQKPGWGYSNGLAPTAADPNLSGVDVPGLPPDWNSMANTDWRDSVDSSVMAALDVKATDNWDLRAAYSGDNNTIAAEYSGNLGVTNGSYFQGRRVRGAVYTNTSNTVETQATGKYQVGGMSVKLLLGAQYNPYSFYSWLAQAPNSTSPNYSPASPLPPWNLQDPTTWNRVVPSDLLPFSALTASRINTITNSKDTAFYGGATLGFFKDDLLVLAGARRTSSTSETDNLITGILGTSFSTAKNTPQIGALYKITPDLSAFATYSESFVPNARVLYGVDKSTPAWSQYVIGPAAPTLGKGYDLGLKSSLLGGRVSGTLTFFQVQQTNIPNDISEFNANTGFQYSTTVQSGLQRSTGVEFDTTLSPTNNWQIYLSASVMKAEIVYFYTAALDAQMLAVTDPTTLNVADQAIYKNVIRYHGRPLQDSAPRQFNLWTKYSFTGDLNGFYVGGGANYISDQTLLPDTPSSAHQTYTLWNAIAGYTTKIQGHETSFEVNGKNLGNEYYRPSQSSRARPREIIFSVSTKF